MKFLVPIYNRNKSEAEIQADTYSAIIRMGLDPKLEVRGYLLSGRKCLFDIVVFWPLNHFPICIIECKKGHGVSKDNTQIERYRRFNLPVLVAGKSNQHQTLLEVLRLAEKDITNAPPSFNASQLKLADSFVKELKPVSFQSNSLPL